LTNKEVRFDRTANARICAISRLCNFRWVIVKQVCDAYKARELHDSSRPTLGETYKAICDDLESNSDSRNENCIDRSVSPLDDTCNSNFSDDAEETADSEGPCGRKCECRGEKPICA
ncbi:hypothetical protein L915_20531, partial [Phytophthora nicotianae]